MGRACAAHIRFNNPDAIEDVPSAIRGMDLEMWQSGHGAGRWSFVEADLGDVIVQSGEMAAPHITVGAADTTAVSFFVKVRGEGDWTLNSETIDGAAIAALGRGAEVSATAAGAMSWLSLQICPKKLEPYLDGAAQDAGFFRTGGAQVIRPRPELVHTLRRGLATVARYAVHDAESLSSAQAKRSLQAQLLHALVGCLRAPPTPQRSSHTRVAHQAVAYMQAHDDDIIQIADLCAATGISDRWLRQAFNQVYGMSPKRLLRLRRLNQVHRTLLAGAPESSVTGVATAHGFFDLGRFAMFYRTIFGESPSATLRQSEASRRRMTPGRSSGRRDRQAL